MLSNLHSLSLRNLITSFLKCCFAFRGSDTRYGRLVWLLNCIWAFMRRVNAFTCIFGERETPVKFIHVHQKVRSSYFSDTLYMYDLYIAACGGSLTSLFLHIVLHISPKNRQHFSHKQFIVSLAIREFRAYLLFIELLEDKVGSAPSAIFHGMRSPC